MPLNDAFEHNGISIITSEPPPPMGPPGEDVVCIVGVAPDKDAAVQFNNPVRVANQGHWPLIDSTGNELGTLIQPIMLTHQKTAVTIYVIVVPEGVDAAATQANVIGGVDAVTKQREGISAMVDCLERPTIIAAPGFSHDKAVIDALAVMGKKLGARVVVDGPSTTTDAAIALSDLLGGADTGHERVYMVDPAVSVYSRAAKGDVLVPGSAVAIGALAAVKQWESPGNQGLLITGTDRTIEYNILDKTSEADLLNKNGIAAICHTSMGGWSLIGNRTVTGKFISYVGLEDTISRKLELASQRAMSNNLTKTFMDQEVRKINNFVQDLVRAEIIPGGEVYLHPVLNTVERYKNGSWYIVLDYGRYAPNEHMIFHVNAVDRIVESFLEGVLNG